jgi:DNA-directed RNA polymerase specialized sigma24 family protein
LRFFQLFVGDEATAELLTIETMVEEAHDLVLDVNALPLGLLRRALKKAERASDLRNTPEDRIVRGIAALPPAQRAALILFRGLSLDLVAVANVTKRDVSEVKRLCTDALLAVHRLRREDARNGEVQGHSKSTAGEF